MDLINKLKMLSKTKFAIKNLLITLIIYFIIYRNRINISSKQINIEINKSKIII